MNRDAIYGHFHSNMRATAVQAAGTVELVNFASPAETRGWPVGLLQVTKTYKNKKWRQQRGIFKFHLLSPMHLTIEFITR